MATRAETGLAAPMVARWIGVDYRTFANWIRRGFIVPSVHHGTGSGDRHSFSPEDVGRAGVLAELTRAGMSITAAAAMSTDHARRVLVAIRDEPATPQEENPHA